MGTRSSPDPWYEPYEVLGLKRNARQDEVDKAYKNLVLRTHPINFPEQHERFNEVCRAYWSLRQRAPVGREACKPSEEDPPCSNSTVVSSQEVFCGFVTLMTERGERDESIQELVRLLQLMLEVDTQKKSESSRALGRTEMLESKREPLGRDSEVLLASTVSSSPSVASSSSPPVTGIPNPMAFVERRGRKSRSQMSPNISVSQDFSMDSNVDDVKPSSWAALVKRNLPRSPSSSSISSHAGGSSFGFQGLGSSFAECIAAETTRVPTVVVQSLDGPRLSYRWWKKGVVAEETVIALTKTGCEDEGRNVTDPRSRLFSPLCENDTVRDALAEIAAEAQMGSGRLNGYPDPRTPVESGFEDHVKALMPGSEDWPILADVGASAYRALRKYLPEGDILELERELTCSSPQQCLQTISKYAMAVEDQNRRGRQSPWLRHRDSETNYGVHSSWSISVGTEEVGSAQLMKLDDLSLPELDSAHESHFAQHSWHGTFRTPGPVSDTFQSHWSGSATHLEYNSTGSLTLLGSPEMEGSSGKELW